jgi:hypothetical protein
MRAQEYIRVKAYEQVSSLTREVLEATCRMQNFAYFYNYFMWFITMVKEGEVGKRLKKQEIATLSKVIASLP